MPIVTLLVPGNFVMAALLTGVFHLPKDIYGWVVSLPFWGNFAQAFLLPLVQRRLAPKAVAVTAAWLQLVCWGVVAVALPWLPTDHPQAAGRWFLLIGAFSAAVSAFTVVGWSSWVQEWVPPRLRGRYFGRRNRLLQLSTIAFLALAGSMIDLERPDGSVRAFQILIGAAVLLRIVSALAQEGIHAAEGHALAETATPWREQIAVLARTPAFLWFVAFGAVWGFAANCFGPFYYVFLYEQIHFSVREVALLVILVSVGGVLSYPAWGVLAHRLGNKPVILFCLLAWQVQNYLWCFITPENAWLLWFMWTFGGMMVAGLVLGLFNIQLTIIPPAAKTLAISVNLAVTALVTALAPIAGGWVLARYLTPAHDALAIYHAVFLVQPTLAILACLLLARVHEPAARPLASVVGAMRNIRTLSGVLGLGFLADHVFYPSARKR